MFNFLVLGASNSQDSDSELAPSPPPSKKPKLNQRGASKQGGSKPKFDLWGCSNFKVKMSNAAKEKAENELANPSTRNMLDLFELTKDLQRNELEDDGVTFKPIQALRDKYPWLNSVRINLIFTDHLFLGFAALASSLYRLYLMYHLPFSFAS